MNEITITLNGQTYLIPSNKYGELVSWLTANTVQQQNVLTSEQAKDSRKLILES